MSTYDHYSMIINTAPLDDLISGEHGPELANLAQDLAEAFSAMSVEQLVEACHHDHRLSGRLRKLAYQMSFAVETRAAEQATDADEADHEDAAFQCGWNQAGDEIATERQVAV